MTTKRRSPVKVRNPGEEIEIITWASFSEVDIPKLAEGAGLPLLATADHAALASKLNRAFYAAHALGVTTKRMPSPPELREAYGAAAKAGREFLLALGIGEAPERIIGRSLYQIGKASKVLGQLVRWAPDKSVYLPQQIVEALAPDRRLAHRRMIVEAARAAAYVVLVAEAGKAAVPPGSRRGPRKDAFSPVLMHRLVECYLQMFGALPAVPRESGADGEYHRVGPAIKWLRDVIAMANRHINSDDASRFTQLDEMRKAMAALEDNSIETLASKFEEAVRGYEPDPSPAKSSLR
ncbi:MAG: hypothetical protein WA441_10695 [Methyloceanibacter sp.]